jgi:hypothetical protein
VRRRPHGKHRPHKRTDRRLDCQMALSLVFGFVATTTAIVAFATVG